MRTAKYEFKCRKCDELYYDGTESSENVAEKVFLYLPIMKDMAEVQRTTRLQLIQLHEVTTHKCSDGSYGLADLVGYNVVEE